MVLEIVNEKLSHPASRELELLERFVLSFELRLIELVDGELSSEIIALEADKRSIVPVHRTDDGAENRKHESHGKHADREGLNDSAKNELKWVHPMTVFEPCEDRHRDGMEHEVAKQKTER